jgi:membrane metallo-endopeptidase-like protein 1
MTRFQKLQKNVLRSIQKIFSFSFLKLIVKTDLAGYLENTLHIIKFWRFFYYNRLRDKIDTKHWLKHGDVSLVNAFYSLEGNNIEFPAGILQGAFFNAKNPRYMNFGAIGSVIGHEITHGFDDRGKQRNGQGKFLRPKKFSIKL